MAEFKRAPIDVKFISGLTWSPVLDPGGGRNGGALNPRTIVSDKEMANDDDVQAQLNRMPM